MTQKTLIRRKAKLTDLTPRDIYLLGDSYGLNDEQYFCYGRSFFILRELNFVSDECQITYHGRQFLYELTNNKEMRESLNV